MEQVHTVFHRALGQALRWGLLGRNPTDAVNVPRPERREMMTLSADQVTQLLEASRSDREYALWVVLVSTGIRLGEALGLRWSDLDLDRGQAHIHRALQRQTGVGLVLTELKTAGSRRTILLPQHTLAVLKERRIHQLEERVEADGWSGQDFVFCTPIGTGLDASNLSRKFHRTLERAGVPQVRLHDLRHTAATLLMADGVNPKVVQEMLGHSTIVLTLGTYSHVSPGVQDQAAASMDRLLGR